MTQGRSANVAEYPGRPLDFGASIAGAGAGALYASCSYGPSAGALSASSTPGSFFMMARPCVLDTFASYIQNLTVSGDQVTLQLLIDDVITRTLVCTFDDGTAAPFPGGIYNLLTFDPVIVEAGQRVAIQWPNDADPSEAIPHLITVFVQ